MNFIPTVAGEHTVRLVVWDHDNQVGSAVRTFTVCSAVEQGHLTGWESCFNDHKVHASVVLKRADGHTPIADDFGYLEEECVDGSMRIRWRTKDGKVRTIGQCVYKCGENYGTFVFDICKKRYTRFVWRNEEGHPGNPKHDPNACICDQIQNNQYDFDEYIFDPVSGRLQIEHGVQDLRGCSSPSGDELRKVSSPSRFVAGLDDVIAADSYLSLTYSPFPQSHRSNLGAGNVSVSSRLHFFGIGPSGILRARIAEHALSVPLSSGTSASDAARLLQSAINTDQALSELGVEASVSEAVIEGVTQLALVNVAEADIQLSLETLESGTLSILRGADWPQLRIEIAGSLVRLEWEKRGVLNLPVLLERGLVTQAGISWEPVTEDGHVVINGNRFSLQVTADQSARYFRLNIRP